MSRMNKVGATVGIISALFAGEAAAQTADTNIAAGQNNVSASGAPHPVTHKSFFGPDYVAVPTTTTTTTTDVSIDAAGNVISGNTTTNTTVSNALVNTNGILGSVIAGSNGRESGPNHAVDGGRFSGMQISGTLIFSQEQQRIEDHLGQRRKFFTPGVVAEFFGVKKPYTEIISGTDLSEVRKYLPDAKIVGRITPSTRIITAPVFVVYSNLSDAGYGGYGSSINGAYEPSRNTSGQSTVTNGSGSGATNSPRPQ